MSHAGSGSEQQERRCDRQVQESDKVVNDLMNERSVLRVPCVAPHYAASRARICWRRDPDRSAPLELTKADYVRVVNRRAGALVAGVWVWTPGDVDSGSA